MLYSAWGGRDDTPSVSKIGFGTTRFNPSDLKDSDGIERCASLVEYAIKKGINYFDVAPTYSYGYAEKILGEAFKNCGSEIYVAAKTGLAIDKTADDLRKRLDTSLKQLNRDYIDFYHIWSVMDFSQYLEAIKPGGLYEGALKAKEEGLIKHLCVSVHCDVEDTLKIIKDGLFEGITISMNAMNYRKWLPVLEETKRRKMGVATMNSLAGGVIPLYGNLFAQLDETDNSVPVKALRFLSSFEEIDVALSGMTSFEQIDENCSAFEKFLNKANKTFEIHTSQTLCSGCNYCAPCAVGIPISACLQAYNHKILLEAGNVESSEKSLANDIFIRVRANGVSFPELKSCIGCRVCEKRCTQKIDISQRMKELEGLASKYNYTREKMRDRLKYLEKECENSKRIAVWPACDYATSLFDLWDNKALEDKCEYFNSSSAMWGKEFRGKIIKSPEELEKSDIDTVLITHYTLRNEIYNDLKSKVSSKIKIIKVNSEDDINWFNQAIGK